LDDRYPSPHSPHERFLKLLLLVLESRRSLPAYRRAIRGGDCLNVSTLESAFRRSRFCKFPRRDPHRRQGCCEMKTPCRMCAPLALAISVLYVTLVGCTQSGAGKPHYASPYACWRLYCYSHQQVAP
jgi:hypothetical protein